MKKTMLCLLSLLLCAALCACAAVPAQKESPSAGGAVPDPAPDERPLTLRAAGDYDEVLSLLSAGRESMEKAETAGGRMFNAASDMAMPESATADTAAPAAAPEAPQENADLSGAPDYSGTNVQVAGIDEGDLVKTDGSYLYTLDGENGVRILKAAGADTREVSRIVLTGESWYNSELYIDGDTLVVVRTEYDRKETSKDGTRTVALLYDVSDRGNPAPRGTLGQDGYYTTSRLLDGKLYLVSNLSVWYWAGDAVPQTRQYVPCVYAGGAESALAPDCIWLPERADDQSYTVLTAIDVRSGERLSEQAVLGCTGTVYMNGKNLYLASARYENTESAPRTEDQYTVIDYSGAQSTQLTRFALDGGALTLKASGEVPGTLLNQFSLDEQDGFLRLVTTIERYSYAVYTDEKHGFSNYVGGENTSANALYVLDEGLKTVGSVEDLAPGERVYSVRFAGDIGYFVTYKQIDPLFAVDLSDPTAPRVLSALKIPGFSQYLHVYGDGLLFGLGQNTSGEDGTVRDGLKLSMFDISDPANVTERTTLALPGDWSQAQYNHKAILVLPQKDVIAFPMDGGYVVYGYSAEEGFYQRASMELDGALWMDEARGVQIGELFYLCARNGVGVYSLTDFSRVAGLTF